MNHAVLSRALLVLGGVFASTKASAFAIFVVPFGTTVTPGDTFDLTMANPVVPAAFGAGVPLTWKQSSVGVTLAFAPNPSGPLTNGTTTWNQNAASAIIDWNVVGAQFAFAGAAGSGDPCITDGVVVAAFEDSVCLGLLPSIALGISRIVALADSAISIRIVDADIAILTPNTASVSGAMVTDAFDGPITFPNFDFRRLVLHELGHSLGLAHPDSVFGDTAETRATVMHSQSVVDRLSSDDKNGALALYPAPAAPVESDGGGGGGGGGNGLVLALLAGVFALVKALRPRLLGT